MVRGRKKAEVSASKIGTKANVPAETTPTETDVFEPVTVDIPDDENVSQCNCEMQTTLEQIESEDLALVIASVESKENKVDAVEEEEIMGGHAEEGSGGGEEGDFDDDADEDENGHDDDVGVENDYADDDYVSNENDYDDGENDSGTDDFGDDDDFDENGDMMDEEDDSDEDRAYCDVDDDCGEEEDMPNALADYAKEYARECEDYQVKSKEGEVKEETRKEKNMEGGNRRPKQTVKPLRKGSDKKKVKNGSSNEVASKGEDNQEGGQDDAMEEEDKQEGQNDATKEEDVLEDIGKKRKGSSMLKDRKLMKRSKGKGPTAGRSEKEATKRVEKPESQSKKMSSKKVAGMGMIFLCSSKTKRDCYHYMILGLPASKRDQVEKIYKGMRLFLYDIDLKLLYGIYKAAGRGGYNIQPKAFNSHFPSQVRFTILDDCLPLAEEKFKKVIKDNYYSKTKFQCQLTSKQVKDLCKLFLASSQGTKSKKFGRSLKAGKHTSAGREWSRDRAKKWRPALEESQYRDYPIRREREVVLGLPPLPHLGTGPLRHYDRALGMDAYRHNQLERYRNAYREPVLEPRGTYRPAPVLGHRDVYRQEPRSSYHDSFRRDLVLPQDEVDRYDPCISYSEHPERRDAQSWDETRHHRPYLSYREHNAYRDRLYTRDLLVEHDRSRPCGRSPEYRSAVAPGEDFHFAQYRYRY